MSRWTGNSRRWYAWLLLGLTLMALAVYNTWYTNHTARQICGLVVAIDQANHAVPPTSDRGRQIADQISRYRSDIGCQTPKDVPNP